MVKVPLVRDGRGMATAQPVVLDAGFRYEGPIVRAGRVAHDDVKVGETLVWRGEFVHAFLGAANRDVLRRP